MQFKEGLELEESELFDHEEELDTNHSPELTHASLQDEAAHSDSDDGINLDDDDETSAEGVHITGTSLEQPIPIPDHLSTSHTTSTVGSLKRFDSLTRSGPLKTKSENDLGIAAASLPTHMMHNSHAYHAQRWQHGSVNDLHLPSSFGGLGTSMPIRIPAHMMNRRGLAAAAHPSIGSSAELRDGGNLNFTPPHLHHDSHHHHGHHGHNNDAGHNDNVVSDSAVLGSSFQGSPSGVDRRDKLRARNAILRSTGFIEPGFHAFSKAPLPETIDVLKESIMQSSGALAAANKKSPGSVGVGIPTPNTGLRMKPTSSLTALLGTSS